MHLQLQSSIRFLLLIQQSGAILQELKVVAVLEVETPDDLGHEVNVREVV